jgi:Camelysin metallo-endopeptidase
MKFITALSAAQLGRFVLVATLATGALSTTVGRGTMAYFTTQVTSVGNTFTAGNLHFEIDDRNGNPGTSVTSSMELRNLKPGDVVYAPVTVTNTGSINAKWGIKYTTTTSADNLATALQLAIVGKGSGTAAATDCDSAHWADALVWKERVLETPENMTDAGRTIVNYQWATQPAADGAYTNAEAAASHFLPLHAGVDDAGVATGDALATDMLCIQVKFPNGGYPADPTDPTSGDNVWNGATPDEFDTTIVFTFDAVQRELSREVEQN